MEVSVVKRWQEVCSHRTSQCQQRWHEDHRHFKEVDRQQNLVYECPQAKALPGSTGLPHVWEKDEDGSLRRISQMAQRVALIPGKLGSLCTGV